MLPILKELSHYLNEKNNSDVVVNRKINMIWTAINGCSLYSLDDATAGPFLNQQSTETNGDAYLWTKEGVISESTRSNRT